MRGYGENYLQLARDYAEAGFYEEAVQSDHAGFLDHWLFNVPSFFLAAYSSKDTSLRYEWERSFRYTSA